MRNHRSTIKILAVIGTTGLILIGFGSPSGLDPVFGRVGGAPRFSMTRSMAQRMSAPRATQPRITAPRITGSTMAARSSTAPRTTVARSVAPRQTMARASAPTANRTKLAVRVNPAPTQSTIGFRGSKTPSSTVSRPSPAAISGLTSAGYKSTGMAAQKPTGFSRTGSALSTPGRAQVAGTIASRPAAGTSSPGTRSYTAGTVGSLATGTSRAGVTPATPRQPQLTGTTAFKPAAITATAPARSNIAGTIAANPKVTGLSGLTARTSGQTRVASATPAGAQAATPPRGNIVGTKPILPYTSTSGKQASVSPSGASGTSRQGMTREQAATVLQHSKDKWERFQALGTLLHGDYDATSSGSKTATSPGGNVAATKPTTQSRPTGVTSAPSTGPGARQSTLQGEDHHRRPHGLNPWRMAEREASVDRLRRLFPVAGIVGYPTWTSDIRWTDSEGRDVYVQPTAWPTDIDARAIQRDAASEALDTTPPTESSAVAGGPPRTAQSANPPDPELISQLDRIRGQLTQEAQQDLPDPKDLLQGLNLPPDLQRDLIKSVQDSETRESIVKHLNQMNQGQREEAVKFLQNTAQDPRKLKETMQVLKGDDLKKKMALAEGLPPQLKNYAKEQVKKTVKETFKDLLRQVMPADGFKPHGNLPVAGTRG